MWKEKIILIYGLANKGQTMWNWGLFNADVRGPLRPISLLGRKLSLPDSLPLYLLKYLSLMIRKGFPGGVMVKNLHANAGNITGAESLGWEDSLEKSLATHSRNLVWKMAWTEEPAGLWSIGLHRVGHDWSDLAHTHTWKSMHMVPFYKQTKKAYVKLMASSSLSFNVQGCVPVLLED